MVYNICVICMVKDTALRSVYGETRQLLEAIVSPVVDLHPLRHTQLLACEGCQKLLATLVSFQKTALVGVKNLLSLPYYKQLFTANSVTTGPRAPRPPLQRPAPAAAGPSRNPTPLVFQIMGPRVGPAAGAWRPVSARPQTVPSSTMTPTLLVTPLVPSSTEPVERLAPVRPGPSADSEDPLSVPIKTEHEVEIDFKLEIEPETDTLREQLTHEVDIKLEPDDDVDVGGGRAGSPSATDSASDFEEDVPQSTVTRSARDQEQAPHELSTPDVPLITTFTHTQRPTRAYGASKTVGDVIEETLRTLPKLPKLAPRPPAGAARPPPGAASALTRRPPIKQLESSVQAMEQTPALSRSGAAGRAPASAAPPEHSVPQSWYVRVLPDAEVAAARAAALAAPEFAGARHKCRACVAVFRCETGKALHDKTHHPFADGRYQCRICGHREGEVDAWRAHVRTHATRYCCCYCAFSTGEVTVIRQHYCEPKLQQWEKTSFVKGLFKDKEKKKVLPPEKCPKCHTRFADKGRLQKHQERMHSKPDEPQTCKICNKQFKNRNRLYHHMYVHREQELLSQKPELLAELYCAECERSFDTAGARRQHQLSVKHSGRDHWKHECDECGRVFASKYRVKQHIQIVHLKQLNYKCSLCPARLCTASRLRRHERSHGPQQRPHVCHICGKAYTIKKSLREHLQAHAGLRPLVCKLCPATFTYSAALFTHHRLKHLKVKMTWKKHARTTKKDAPKEGKVEAQRKRKTKKEAADEQCNKRSLQQHLQAHAGLRPLVCKLCPATFTYSGALFMHNRLKHLKVKMTWKKRARTTKKDAPKEGKVEAQRKRKTKKEAVDEQCVK